VGSRCVMNEMIEVNSCTAIAVSWGLFDSHSALPRLYRANAVWIFFSPDFSSWVVTSALRSLISMWAFVTILS